MIKGDNKNVKEIKNKTNKYQKYLVQIDLSYSTTDTAYPENNLDSVLKENPLDAQLVKDLKSIEGVTEVKIGKQLLKAMKSPS